MHSSKEPLMHFVCKQDIIQVVHKQARACLIYVSHAYNANKIDACMNTTIIQDRWV